MISPSDIQQQALKWWVPFLQSYLNKEVFFPKQIDRIGKVRPGQITANFENLQQEIQSLYRSSKNETGKGYWIKTKSQNFRRTGNQELPEAIVFESIEDYVHVVGKRKEWILFQQNMQLLQQTLPQLQEWLWKHPEVLTKANIEWGNILNVLNYFLQNPRSNLYLRQLPIAVHTKFIEENAALIQSLLDFLIPEHIRAPEQKKFSEHFFLRYDEPLIRIRILDEKLMPDFPFKDLSIPLSTFETSAWACRKILIAENKMNFLTLPALPEAIALWSGGGFNVSFLKNVTWLLRLKIYYWGDIDEHGFQILHQLRSYFPQTQSVMMDRFTFDTFQEFAVAGAKNPAVRLPNLTEEEAELYTFLQNNPTQNRLEQERISQAYADAYLQKIDKD